jgi:hypothetical protein
MSKKTAVEWLIEKLPLIQQEGLRDEIEQAKEMDKEQKIDAFDTGRRKGDWIFDGEKYYEETYKNS